MEGEEDGGDSWLVGERIRRTINFCLEVISDSDAGRITEDTKGLAELLESVEQISQRFRSLLAPGGTHPLRNAQMRSPEPSTVGRRGRAESRGD